jgi:hypothetical protein
MSVARGREGREGRRYEEEEGGGEGCCHRITKDIQDKMVSHDHSEDLSVLGLRMEDQPWTSKEGKDNIFLIDWTFTQFSIKRETAISASIQLQVRTE